MAEELILGSLHAPIIASFDLGKAKPAACPQAIGAYSVIEPNRPEGRPTDCAEVSPGEYGRHRLKWS